MELFFSTVFATIVGAALGTFATLYLRSRGTATPPPAEAPAAGADDGSEPPPEPSTEPSSPPAVTETGPSERIHAIASKLQSFFESTAHPNDLLSNERFREGVTTLREASLSESELLTYALGDNPLISCFALEALAGSENPNEVYRELVKGVNAIAPWARFFALRVFRRVENPSFGRSLAHFDGSWGYRLNLQFLRDFHRDVGGESDVEHFTEELADASEDHFEGLEYLLGEMDNTISGPFKKALEKARKGQIETEFLNSFGRLWSIDEPARSEPTIVEHDALRSTLQLLRRELELDPPRSLLVLGEPGVGKKTALRQLLAGLVRDGWTVFEAGAVDVIAGQMYIGQLEERLKKLLQQLSGRERVIWFIPDLHEMLWAGRTHSRPTGALDYILPAIDRGEVLVVSTIEPAPFEQLAVAKPMVRTALETVRVSPLSSDETTALAEAWSREVGGETPAIERETIDEALQLSQQYLGERALPGSLLGFLSQTLQSVPLTQSSSNGNDEIRRPIDLDDLIQTLSRVTGLPADILDERQELSLSALRSFFAKRIIGQTEAIDCLVERVAMIKAGLTDPTRPFGVFLFTGPTGSGKTEIAKTLAEFLFGSAERMIRIDMSELQTVDSLDRILGSSGNDREKKSLVREIREQPFSVLLLDEFEKSHPNVWDLFLQVFDDGRLTDRQGSTADFRHSVVIMTSNLGADVITHEAIGFGGGPPPRVGVQKILEEAFRKEFLNRIDRIVVFRAFDRAQMRMLLKQELNRVLRRRGLRNRAWAFEWEDSAIDFLLERGFTPDLGARPLKRAIDRYLLAPLGTTIVTHQYPEGDQFLFIRRRGAGIEVEFVDPDAPAGDRTATSTDGEFSLRQLALEPSGGDAEAHFLEEEIDRVFAQIESPEWTAQKEELLAQMSTSGFWESSDRFSVLGSAEYMDRIEAGSDTARSLQRRLGSGSTRSAELIRRLAQQLYLLDEAITGLGSDAPRDAFVAIEGEDIVGEDAPHFAPQITEMYRAWGEKRRMHVKTLLESNAEGEYRAILAVSGFGAYSILAPERGLHVLESPERGSAMQRSRVRVLVAPQPAIPTDQAPRYLDHAREALDPQRRNELAIVRRYREHPTPLVRDSIRQWKTGRLDRVLGGDFDLVTG